MNKIFAEQGYDFEGVPFGPAAGAINGPNEEEIRVHIKDVARSQAEAVKWGSLTWNGGLGNAEIFYPVYYHNPATGQTVNSMGLPNVGHDRGLALQREMQPIVEAEGKPLIPSFSPGKGEDPFEVLPQMAYDFAEAGTKILEVNLSCPNKILEGEQREATLGHDREIVDELDDRIRAEVGSAITIIYKEPPFVGEHSLLMPRVEEFYHRVHRKTAANFSNTIGGQRIPNESGDPALGVPGNLGGMSGPYTKEAGRRQLRELGPRLPKAIGAFSCLGVDSGYEVFYRVDELNADYTEGVTLFWENQKHGISFGQTMHRVAEEYAQAPNHPMSFE
jgi:dihydroorotate dehydrogenase